MNHFAALTSRGLRRSTNQDAIAIQDKVLSGEITEPVTGTLNGGRALFAVADGVGGRAHGERASRELMTHLIAQEPPEAWPAACVEVVCHAALALHAGAIMSPDMADMATTVAGVAVSDDVACWFNVGDSRVYLQRCGRLLQLSVDDAVDVRSGRRQRYELTRWIGGSRSLVPVPHAGQVRLQGGDRLLICSDGLWGPLSDDETTAILVRHEGADQAARALLEAVLRADGPDNVSIALVQ